VVESAPRYDPRILEAVRALDDRGEPMAEIARRVGRVAAEFGLPKPSYVHLRRYLIEHRQQQELEQRRREEIREILWGGVLGRDVRQAHRPVGGGAANPRSGTLKGLWL